MMVARDYFYDEISMQIHGMNYEVKCSMNYLISTNLSHKNFVLVKSKC